MSYPAYTLPAGTQLPVPTEESNGTRDIAFVAGRLTAGDPWTVITLHRNSHVDANARIVAAGGVIPHYDDVAAFFDDQANNFDYDASAILAREWNLRDGFITEGGVA